MKKPIEWTEAHRREAFRRTWELAAELVRDERQLQAAELLEAPLNMAQEEATWRADLGCAFDPARIEREVRRVDGLATGRLRRAIVWKWRRADGTIAGSWTGTEDEREMLRRAALASSVAWKKAGCRLFFVRCVRRATRG